MQRSVSSTVVALVGDPGAVIDRLAAPNVRALRVGRDAPLDRAVAAWGEVTRTHRPYVVHDADPLAAVADAWVALYDGSGARGDLEVAVAAVRAASRSREVDLPDYYLVAGADGLPATRRHWYLGVLVEAAPHRVVPVAATAPAVLAALGRLPAGRWWPDLETLLTTAVDVVPDRFGAAADDDAPGLALIE
jgi:hypothetical protein